MQPSHHAANSITRDGLANCAVKMNEVQGASSGALRMLITVEQLMQRLQFTDTVGSCLCF